MVACSIEQAISLTHGHGIGRGVDTREDIRSAFPQDVSSRRLPVAGQHARTSGDSVVINKSVRPVGARADAGNLLSQPAALAGVGVAAIVGEIGTPNAMRRKQAIRGEGQAFSQCAAAVDGGGDGRGPSHPIAGINRRHARGKNPRSQQPARVVGEGCAARIVAASG